MNAPDSSSDAAAPPTTAVEVARADTAAPESSAPPVAHRATGRVIGASILTAVAVASLVLAWNTQQRVRALEQELVRRQQATQQQSTEARLLAQQANDAARENVAKVGLLEARVSESALQRSQVEELIQSLSRSRDENVVADVDAAVRLAVQQSVITGSAQPLVVTLQQASERLGRYNQPRLERVRRAVARDLDRARAATTVDVPTLTLRLDEVVRAVDELPLLSTPQRRSATAQDAAQAARAASAPASAASGANPAAEPTWLQRVDLMWQQLLSDIWQEVRSLVRVTQVDEPAAMLMAPDQAFFLRENLKLRLLNARLALLSRQYDLAQADLRNAAVVLDRYFDASSRRVALASETIKQIAGQARNVVLPRPDETLAALSAVASDR